MTWTGFTAPVAAIMVAGPTSNTCMMCGALPARNAAMAAFMTYGEPPLQGGVRQQTPASARLLQQHRIVEKPSNSSRLEPSFPMPARLSAPDDVQMTV